MFVFSNAFQLSTNIRKGSAHFVTKFRCSLCNFLIKRFKLQLFYLNVLKKLQIKKKTILLISVDMKIKQNMKQRKECKQNSFMINIVKKSKLECLPAFFRN